MKSFHGIRFLLAACLFLSGSEASLNARETTPEEAFMRGNIAYGNDAFEEAEAAYRSILGMDRHSAEVHYNLGNALARQEKWNEAAFHYLKAYSLGPNVEPVRGNLLLTARQLGLEEDFPLLPGPASLLPRAHWTAAAALSFWIALFLFLHPRLVPFRIPLARLFAFLASACFLIALTAILQHQQFRQWAIVASPSVSLRVAPTELSPGESQLRMGSPVRVLDERDPFLRVGTSNGNEGFIRKTEVHPLRGD